MTPLRRGATKDVVLVVVALVLVAGAVYLYSRLSKPQLASATDTVTFFCPDCNEWLQLTYREFERRQDRREFKAEPGGSFYVKCSKCGKLSAERKDKEVPRDEGAEEPNS